MVKQTFAGVHKIDVLKNFVKFTSLLESILNEVAEKLSFFTEHLQVSDSESVSL